MGLSTKYPLAEQSDQSLQSHLVSAILPSYSRNTAFIMIYGLSWYATDLKHRRPFNSLEDCGDSCVWDYLFKDLFITHPRSLLLRTERLQFTTKCLYRLETACIYTLQSIHYTMISLLYG